MPYKFHFLTHCPGILLQMSPFINFWCQHRLVKNEANVLSGNKNSLQSIGIKESLKLCYNSSYASVKDKIIFGTEVNFCLSAAAISAIDENLIECAKFFEYIEIQEVIFKIGQILVTKTQQNDIFFGEILVIIHSYDDIYLVLDLYKEEYFDDRTLSYVVERMYKTECVLLKNLSDISVCSIHKMGKKTHVLIPYLL